MPLEKVAEVRAWFEKARKDLAAAELDLGASPPLVEDALFHCQQAAEKAIKGFLTWHDKAFRKIHDIRSISRGVLEVDPTLAPLLERAADLTPFAGVFRYPADVGIPTPGAVRASLALAREVYDVFLGRLPEVIRS